MSKNTKRLYIVSGHSISEPGAVANDVKEGNLTIEMKRLIFKALANQSPDTEVYSDDDKSSLNKVISELKKTITSDDVLLDIHFNAGPSKAKGVECFISMNARDKSKTIAKRICELGSAMLQSPSRGVKFENQSQHPRLGILHTAASSVLWEIDFITNKEAMDNYNEIKERLAIGIANILIQELEKD